LASLTRCTFRGTASTPVASIPGFIRILATNPSTKVVLILISSRSLHSIPGRVITCQPKTIGLVIVGFLHLLRFLFSKRGVAQTLDSAIQLTVNASTSHANECQMSQVRALWKLGATIGTSLVGRIATYLSHKLIWRQCLSLSTIAAIGLACSRRSRGS